MKSFRMVVACLAFAAATSAHAAPKTYDVIFRGEAPVRVMLAEDVPVRLTSKAQDEGQPLGRMYMHAKGDAVVMELTWTPEAFGMFSASANAKEAPVRLPGLPTKIGFTQNGGVVEPFVATYTRDGETYVAAEVRPVE